MLQVFLVMNHIPTPHAPFRRVLKHLKQQTRFHLTVLNNGQPLITPHLFHQMGLTCDILHYPLQFHPAQLLLAQLQHRYGADHILWFEDELIWDPAHLSQWFEASEEWTWISPHLLPSTALPFSERIYQQQAFHALGQTRLETHEPKVFPPCLLFHREQIPTLQEWLQPRGQLPLFMMSACDLNVPAWHPDPFENPDGQEFLIELDEALERWDTAEEQTGLRQLALLESLQRALPESPEIYPLLLPKLSRQHALEMCAEVEKKQWHYPEFLHLLSHALKTSRPTLSAAYHHVLRTRFPAHASEITPWKTSQVSTVPDFHPPQPEALHICILFQGEMGPLFTTLENLLSFQQVELSVLTDPTAPLTLPETLQHIQLLTATTPLDHARCLNDHLQTLESGWFLFLEAGEILSTTCIHFLQQERWVPAPGLPLLGFKHITPDQKVSVQTRMFPVHPWVRFETEPTLRIANPEQKLYAQTLTQGVIEQTQSLNHGGAQSPYLCRRAEVLSQQTDVRSRLEAVRLYHRVGDHHSALSVSSYLIRHLKDVTKDVFYEMQAALLNCLEQAFLLKQPLTPWLHEDLQKYGLNHPDYWYYHGMDLLQQHQNAKAKASFEKSFMHQNQPLKTPYCQQSSRLYAALVTLESRDFHQHKGDMRTQREHLEAAIKHLYNWIQALGEPPAHLLGEIDFPNPYFKLCELALLGQSVQIQHTALDIFTQNLPAEHDGTWSYILETALLYQAGQMDLLPERLPPDLDHEVFRRLGQEPHFLRDFCDLLWHRIEVDGPQIAAAFLWVGAFAQQDASLLMGLYEHLPADAHGLMMLEDALQNFEQEHFICYVARVYYENKSHQKAQQMLELCLRRNPDFGPAKQLKQKIENTL